MKQFISELKIVNMLVQLLGLFLCDDPQSQYREIKVETRIMHDFALSRLCAIGPSHLEAFKKVLNTFPAVKTKYAFLSIFFNIYVYIYLNQRK